MKVTITLGVDTKGKYHVLAGPGDDHDQQRDYLRKLTDAGGKIKDGNKTIQIAEAMVLHSVKGVMGKPRKF